jgi:hypothetical protein
MGARYLKVEEAAIRDHYSTATRADMLTFVPNRTWAEIGVHARRMGIHRTTQAKGYSIQKGREGTDISWSDEENDEFDSRYPHSTRAELLNFFYPRTLYAIQSHAEKRGLHRTREAMGREISIGKKKNEQTRI